MICVCYLSKSSQMGIWTGAMKSLGRTLLTWQGMEWGVFFVSLLNCDLVILLSVINLSQHWFREWLGAWWHQAKTWTNADFS